MVDIFKALHSEVYGYRPSPHAVKVFEDSPRREQFEELEFIAEEAKEKGK